MHCIDRWHHWGSEPRHRTPFWATVCKTVRPMLSGRCLSCPVCNVGVLWPNGWMAQNETWHAGGPWPWPRRVRWGPSYPLKGAQLPLFDPCLLWPNGWMDQDATWYEGRPRPRPHCVTLGHSLPQKGSTTLPQFSAHVYCGQTVAHLSYSWALLLFAARLPWHAPALNYILISPN